MTSSNDDRPVRRGLAFGAGLQWTARWSLRVLLVALGLALLGWVIGQLWVIVLPVALALIVSTLLRPPTAWLIDHGWRPLLAALTVFVVALALVAGVVALLAPSVAGQLGAIVGSASAGLGQLGQWLAGPPFNLGSGQVQQLVDSVTRQLQQSASSIASTALSGLGSVASSLATGLIALVLAFLFCKDGARFLPFVDRWAGERAGPHLNEVLARCWVTLGQFVRTQALVGLADGVLIGAGLAVLGVPLAIPIGVITFVAAFVPYIGAIVAGALAVLIALFSQGVGTAVAALAVVLVVQQLEGNVLQPILQGRTLHLHPAVILLAVTAGGTLFSVVGALLAVPVAAVVSTVLNYLREQAEGRTSTPSGHPDDGSSSRGEIGTERDADVGGREIG